MSQSQRGRPAAARDATQRGRGGGGAAAAPVQLEQHHNWAFWQAMMAASFKKEADAKQLLRRICNAQNDALYTTALQQLNQQLAFANLQLRTVKSPVDQVRYLGVVNTLADAPSKLASKYTIPQREFFRQVVETIATSESYSDAAGALPHSAPRASEMHLLNLDLVLPAATQGEAGPSQAPAGKKLSKQERSSTINDLVSDGWLANAGNGYYCLGPRTFLELSDLLLSLELPDATRGTWQDI